MASFIELFLLREEPCANPGTAFFKELVSEFCLLYPTYLPEGSFAISSPKNPWSFFWNLLPMLPFEPCEDIVVALAMEGRLSSPSSVNPIPPGNAHPGDTWPRFSVESSKYEPKTELGICRPSLLPLAQGGGAFEVGGWRLIAGVLVDP